MSRTVWTAHDAGVEHDELVAVFASRESAVKWLHEERERQILERQRDWENRQEYYSDPEWKVRMQESYPTSDWHAFAAEQLAEPPVAMTPIKDDEFERGDGGIHGFWYIREREVLP